MFSAENISLSRKHNFNQVLFLNLDFLNLKLVFSVKLSISVENISLRVEGNILNLIPRKSKFKDFLCLNFDFPDFPRLNYVFSIKLSLSPENISLRRKPEFKEILLV